MPKKTRDHTVPKFLLRNFGETLHVFDKRNEGHFLTTYDKAPTWERGIETEAVGEYLKILDHEGSKAINNFLNDLRNVSESDRQTIALFSMVLAFRNQSFRNLLQKQVLNNYGRINSDPKLEEFHMRLNKQIANDTLGQKVLHEAPKWALLFYNMHWSVLVNRTQMPFWISDNPAVGYDIRYDSKEHPNAFLTAKGILVYVPLSKNIQLMTGDPTAYHKPDHVQEVTAVKDILHFNGVQVASSSRFIFSSEDMTDIIKRMIHDETDHQITNEYLGKLQQTFGGKD